MDNSPWKGVYGIEAWSSQYSFKPCWSGIGKENLRMQMAKAIPYHEDGGGDWIQSVLELPAGD